MKQLRVTISDVAREAGVSKATVSLVLNGRTSNVAISEATQATVKAAAQRLGYTPNQAARALASRRSYSITMLISNLDNPFFLEIASAAAQATTPREYQLNLVDASQPDAKLRALDHLRGGGTDGLIITIGQDSTRGYVLDALRGLASQGMPVVLLLERSPAPTIPAIRVDNEAAAFQITNHLLGLGHRRIAFLSLAGTEDPLHELGTPVSRFKGYRRALAEAGVAFDQSWLLEDPNPTPAGGSALMHRLLDRSGAPVTAVVCFNDLMAIGAISACNRRGVQVPNEMAVVGFGGIDMGQYTHPPLTTIQHPRTLLGQLAVQTLFDLMEGTPLAELERIVPTELVVRASCGATTSN
jgi:DNA-binding LacI/PurR family transcriptional regulator